MIKYWIQLGDTILSNSQYDPSRPYRDDPEKVNADLVELVLESMQNADGQTFTIKLANIDHKHTGRWMVTDFVRIALIDEGYTATPDSDKPVRVYQDKFPLCKGMVQYVEYDLYNVTIKGSFLEDELGADYPSNELVFTGLKISDAVNKTLDDYEKKNNIKFDRRFIQVENDLVMGNVIRKTNEKYRDIMDFLANMCGAIWWVETGEVPGTAYFHFTDAQNTGMETRVWDFTEKVTLPSYGLNVVGYLNDVVVVGGGNPIIVDPNAIGSEIMDTRRVYGKHKQIDPGTKIFSGPTIFDPTLYDKEKCRERAMKIVITSRQVNKGIAHPEFMGVSPKLTDIVSYTLAEIGRMNPGNTYRIIQGPMKITGRVISKRVEFSADGWVCQLGLKPLSDEELWGSSNGNEQQ